MKKEPQEEIDAEEEDPSLEAEESPQEQEIEGEVMDGEGVMVPEEFQKKVHHLTKKASKHELKHLHDRAYAREEELRMEEESKKNKKGNKPEKFSTSEAPAGVDV